MFLLMILDEDLSGLFLDFSLTLSLCKSVCAHDSCSAVAAAVKCLLHKVVCHPASRILCNNARLKPGQAVRSPSDFCPVMTSGL